jgi:hypothetical protein
VRRLIRAEDATHTALGFSSHASRRGLTGDPFYCHYVLEKSELACLPSRLPSIFIVRKIDKISRRNLGGTASVAQSLCPALREDHAAI